jgi:hypothetical protein
MRHDVITISREYGAGASELAALLGSALEWPVMDSEIPLAVAWRLGIPDDSLEQWDEHAPRLLESIGNAVLLGNPEVLVDPAYMRRPAAREVADATRDVLIQRVATPPVIVVGHGAQMIFRDRPRTLHLRLVAPLADRVRRIVARRGCNDEDAANIAKVVDRDRMHYVQQFHHHDVRDPLLYALLINTGIVPMEDAVSLVLSLVGDEPR